MSDRLLTTREVALFLSVSPETVLRRWRRGEISGVRLASNVLRFRGSEIEAWIDGLEELNLSTAVEKSSGPSIGLGSTTKGAA